MSVNRMRSALLMLALSLRAPPSAADDSGLNITIIHKNLELDVEHSLVVDPSREYILQFSPTVEQRAFPVRVWFLSDAGDVTHPLLLTARQRTGAVTWQLPYWEGDTLLFELQRTLCPEHAAASTPGALDCAAAEGEGEAAWGAVSLHVSSSCARAVTLRLRVEPAVDWRLVHTMQLNVTLATPHVSLFEFPPAMASVRLVVASPDDVCATVAVHALTCPIPQTLESVGQAALRMTVLRSGGAQLSKERYPLGFYIVSVVAPSDTACTGEVQAEREGEGEGEGEWLWRAVWQGAAAARALPHAAPRRKQLHYTIKAALSRREYWTGALVALAGFLLFYVAFGALVLAERWPAWYNCVAPRAKLAEQHVTEAGVEELGAERAVPERRRRRDSTATFDGSDASDTDSEGAGAHSVSPGTASPGTAPPGTAPPGTAPPGTAPPGTASQGTASPNGVASSATDGCIAVVVTQDGVDASVRTDEERRGPFGLPARLRVAALARRRGRVLRARSQRYLHVLRTVAVFYALPVLQFVVAFQLVLNVSGSLDLCYYNFLCAHPFGALSDFNHVFSNVGYLLLGALYMLQLRRRKARRKRHPRDEEYGIPAHWGLSASLGAGLMVVALLSACYHVCPNALNFQFDTAFMYVLAVLSMVKIYQARHPDINARAHTTFGVLAVLIALVVWGVLGGGPLFWSVFTVLHVFTFLLLSLRIYYVGQFRLEKASLVTAAASLGARAAPLYLPRLVALVLANAVNWAFAIYGLIHQSANVASHLLYVVLCNALLHMVFYLGMKLAHGERPRWYAWLYLAGAAAAWAPALYWFGAGSTDWQATAAQSRLLNHECRVLRFYDSHDLWHMMSAVALYLTFNALLTWDDGLAAVRRTDIAVF